MVEDTQKPLHPVSKENIIEKLLKQHRIQLTPEQIELAAPIERYGNYTLPVSFSGVTAQLQVNIGQR
jgi:ribosomal protein L9